MWWLLLLLCGSFAAEMASAADDDDYSLFADTGKCRDRSALDAPTTARDHELMLNNNDKMVIVWSLLNISLFVIVGYIGVCLQCFVAVGCASGRASGQ